MRFTTLTTASALLCGVMAQPTNMNKPRDDDPEFSPQYKFTFQLNGRDNPPVYASTILHKDAKTGNTYILANGTLSSDTKGPSLQTRLHFDEDDDQDSGYSTTGFLQIFSPSTTGSNTYSNVGNLKYRCDKGGYYSHTACLLPVATDENDADYWYRRDEPGHLFDTGNKPTGFFNCEYKDADKTYRAVGYGAYQRDANGTLIYKDGKLVPPEGCLTTFLTALTLKD